jgi:hypothetical protein
MRFCLLFIAMACLIQESLAQQPSATPAPAAHAPTSFAEDLQSPAVSDEAKLKHMFEEKIEAEWAAIKKQDKKAYGDLLADDYEGVEVDGKGERTRIQAMNELTDSNIANYTLWGFKLIPLCPDANLAIYEVTMQFPPKSQVRLSRVYITELWMKRAEEWKIVHSQETHVK